MAVIKKLKQVSGATILESESEGNGYPPIILSEDSKVFGKVLSVIPFSSGEDEMQYIYEKGYKPRY